MKIVVTGGAGYIGSILVPELLLRGHEVTVIDNFMFDQTSLNHVCENPLLDIINGDARDPGVVKRPLVKADVLIPLAALVGVRSCDRDRVGAQTINVGAVHMATQMMAKEQIVLMPITNSGYGVGEPDKHCTEETPMRPISLYGRTKVEAEDIVMSRQNSISFRLATVFGVSPRMRIDLLVNDFTYRAVNDRALVLFEAHFKRNYIHVRDVANAFLHALANIDKLRGNVFNVGLSDANLSKKELCEVIQRHLPSFHPTEAPIGKDPDQRDYIVSNEKIEATGFRPRYSLDDGVVELIKGYSYIRNGVHGNA